MAIVLSLVVALVACSSGGSESPSSTSSTSTTARPTTTTTTTPPYESVVDDLASDALAGRDNQTPGSTRAQDELIDHLRGIAQPLGADFRHPFRQGTNILAVIPGTDLRDQYVILGAHYDHLGSRCRQNAPGDTICNGATDNAAGVAAVLEIGRRLAAGPRPRRSVVLAFWDAEEDGLLGSTAYVVDPPVPLRATTAYVNWDIQGADLLPSLAGTTFAIGAETGGPGLVDATRQASTASTLDTEQLSLVFGQGRSDHAVFVGARVPTVFFSDSTSGCYHTVQDDTSVLDVAKLGQQITTGEALARSLATTDTPPAFRNDAPTATYADAQSLLDVFRRAQPDLQRQSSQLQATANGLLGDIQAIVDAGEAAFDSQSVATLLRAAATGIDLLTNLPCQRVSR